MLDASLAEHADTYQSSRGTLHVSRPARGVLLTRAERTLTTEGGLAIERLMRRIAAEDGRLIVFNDWEAMLDYDSECRTRLTRATLELKGSVEGLHILFASRVVAMGVQVANLAVKIITVHTARPTFEAAVREALHRRR
jgi:hypothetical protein